MIKHQNLVQNIKIPLSFKKHLYDTPPKFSKEVTEYSSVAVISMLLQRSVLIILETLGYSLLLNNIKCQHLMHVLFLFWKLLIYVET